MPTLSWPGAARLSRQVLGVLFLLFAQQRQTFRNAEAVFAVRAITFLYAGKAG